MFVKCAIALSILVGSAICDNSGYSAPSSSYGAPSGSSYSAPASGNAYAAPVEASYAAPDAGYDAPNYDYNTYAAAPEAPFGGFDIASWWTLIPFFLAVLAALIIAQLIIPFISQLFILGIGILPLSLALKAPIVNAILSPFNLVLCNPTGPTIFPPPGRELSDALEISPELTQLLQDGYNSLVHTIQAQFES